MRNIIICIPWKYCLNVHTKEDQMGMVRSTNGRDTHKEFWWENLTERLLGR